MSLLCTLSGLLYYRKPWHSWGATVLLAYIFISILTISAFAGIPGEQPVYSIESIKNPGETDGDYSYCRTGICAGDLEQYFMYSVEASIVYDGDLVVGGFFAAADGTPVRHLARWDGAAWHDLGGGVKGSYANAVFALAIHEGELIVAGQFNMAGDVPARNIAAWDGASWHALGEGIDGRVEDLCVYSNKLVAGGNFDSAGTVNVNDIAAWNGSTWIDLPGLTSESDMAVQAVTVYDNKLIASGSFTYPAGRIASWNGAVWSSLGAGFNLEAQDLTVYNNVLYAAGAFEEVIAGWNGSEWFTLGEAPTAGELVPVIYSLNVYDNKLIAGGNFSEIDNVPANNIAAWNGSLWSTLGSGIGGSEYIFPHWVHTLTTYGSQLTAGGSFFKDGWGLAPGNRIAAWDGMSWNEITATEGMPFAFEIESLYPYGGVLNGEPVSIEVRKIGGTEEMYGFDFMIGFDVAALTFIDITPGILFDDPGDYEWDYFDFQSDTLIDCAGCPSGAIRAVGVAEMNDGSPPAVSADIPDGTVLFTLNFVADFDPVLNCTPTALDFFWMDCADNAVSLGDGSLMVSDGVYDNGVDGWQNIADTADELPTFLGVPESCLHNGEIVPPRFVDFVNGELFLSCDPNPIDARGDINQNGIANEIADRVMYTNWLFYGLGAFGDHIEASIAASDVNADGIALSIEDAVYLARIICGDTLPLPAPPAEKDVGDTLILVQDLSSNTVSFEYGDTLAAAYLIFEGDITPQNLLDTTQHRCGWHYDGQHTYVLIEHALWFNPESFRNGFTEGPLFTYTGFGKLVASGTDYRITGAADYDNNLFTMMMNTNTQIQIIGGYDGAAAISPMPLPRSLARIGQSETVALYIGDFAEHGVEDLDIPSLLINDTIVPISTTLLPPPPEFSGGVLEIIVPARSFLHSYYFGPDTTGGYGSWYEIFDTLSTRSFVFEVSGSFTDVSTFNTLGNVTIFDEAVKIPVPSGWPSIGEAVSAAQTFDTVEVADGVYAGDNNRDISLSGKSLVIQSVNGPEYTTIECNGSPSEPHRAFHSTVAEESGTIIDGFTIVLGYFTGGGGISVVHSDLTINNCYFIECDAENGAAISCHGASPTISNCLFFRNTAEYGGAIHCWATSNPFINNCTFAENTGALGGSVLYCYRSSPQLDACLVVFNHEDVPVYLLDGESHPQFACSDIYGNAGGDWVGYIADQLGIYGNISLDPMFCDSLEIDFRLDGMSPCLSSNNGCGKLIGVFGAGCGVLCGDISGNGRVDVGDIVYLIAHLFREGPAPADMGMADLNGNSEPDIGDGVILVNYIFREGPPPDCTIE